MCRQRTTLKQTDRQKGSTKKSKPTYAYSSIGIRTTGSNGSRSWNSHTIIESNRQSACPPSKLHEDTRPMTALDQPGKTDQDTTLSIKWLKSEKKPRLL